MEEPIIYNKYLVSFTKIIAVYSFLYVVLRFISIFFLDSWKLPNAILATPFLIIGILTFNSILKKKYNWTLMIIGIVLIVFVRIFESEIILHLHKSM